MKYKRSFAHEFPRLCFHCETVEYIRVQRADGKGGALEVLHDPWCPLASA